MISEVDIKDWDRDIKSARAALEDLDDFSRMGGVDPYGPYGQIEAFITRVEELVHNKNKQVAVLFQPPKT